MVKGNHKMNYAFLGRLIPPEMEQEVKNLSVKNMQDATNALQWHLYEGLCENIQSEICILNVLPIGSFPQYYKKMFVKTKTFTTTNCNENKNIGFCNFKFIRNFVLTRKVKKHLINWFKKN